MTALLKHRSLLVVTVVALAVVMSFGAVACRGKAKPRPTPEPTQATESPAPTQVAPPPSPSPAAPAGEPTVTPGGTGRAIPVRIYLVRGEKIGVAGRTLPAGTTGIASATVNELLQAPKTEDVKYALGSAIPKGTKLRGLDIKTGVATVDLSSRFTSGGGSLSMQLRVAQVVGTLTQFPTVSRVAFRIDGTPVKSIGGEGVSVSPPVNLNDFENVLPAILVEGPVPGQTVSNPFRLFGSANVFEAQFNMRLVQEGKTLVSKSLMATAGSGTRGTFSTSIKRTSGQPGRATLEVYDISAKDGSRIDLVRIPVTLK
jgi:Sporulation and spore germination/Immunoglobulin-like domain of bacterial spore germination